MLLHYNRPVLPCWVILTIHKTTSCQHILFQMVFFLSPEDICHFVAPAYIIGSCMKVLFISWNGFYWKEMHFHVNVLGFAAPHCCLPPWFWLYSQFFLLVFGRLLRAYVLDFSCLICEILLTSRKVLQKNLLLISKLMCFVAEPRALSSSFLTTSLIYGETNIGGILWDHAVLFLRVTFGISMQEGK